ncbi:MAG TPA: DUF1003 domain-containing protein [Actinomycetota bacterium]|nr:DUF1003 domain-containing protein [Actinomycetota bacterium]
MATRTDVEMHPGLAAHAQRRSESIQNRITDSITGFAGSMYFVYVHVVWFTVWIVFRVEHYPYGLLTMIVSLEAIFLSTFVMISQNRQDEAREAFANQEYAMVQAEERQNEELLDLSKKILELTQAVHQLVERRSGS